MRSRIATCSVETGGQNLWLSFAGEPVSVRIRPKGKLPRQLAALDGRTVALSEVLEALPPIKASDFRRMTQAGPELQASVGEWRVSAIAPATGKIGENSERLVQLEAWVKTHLVTPAGPDAPPDPQE